MFLPHVARGAKTDPIFYLVTNTLQFTSTINICDHHWSCGSSCGERLHLMFCQNILKYQKSCETKNETILNDFR